MESTIVNIELSKDISEKLQILQQTYKRKTGTSLSASTLLELLITKEFIRETTPFDLKEYESTK
ncbi:DUF3924 family protein [Microbacteriaceae bacterium 4G12]